MENLGILLIIVTFVAVAGLIGAVAFFLRDTGTKSTSSRLDIIVGGKRREDSKADILKASAIESDQKTLLELITPNIPSLERVFEQADCNIKPSALVGVGLALAGVGMLVSWWFVGWFALLLGPIL